MVDIIKMSDRVSSYLGDWIDAFKRVMYLWHSNSDLASGINIDVESGNDADDFYVFIYDEEERDRTQIIRKSTHQAQQQ